MPSRKEVYNAQLIRQHVARLRKQASKLLALATAMEELENIEEIEVDGSLMMLRGLDQIDNFSNNVDRAIREKIREEH